MVNEFDLELFGSKNPVIWRRFLISDDCTFMEFHYALQILFDWQNCHMFCFKPERNRGNWLIADKRYEEPIDRNDIIEDAREVKLKDIFSPSRKVFSTTTITVIIGKSKLRSSIDIGRLTKVSVCPVGTVLVKRHLKTAEDCVDFRT